MADIDRRLLLRGGAFAAAGAATASPVQAQSEITWRMATSWPKDTPGVGVNAQRLADRITALSGGRLKVRLYAANELVPPFEVFDAVSLGTAEMGHATPYYWAGKNPALHYFTGVPFGLFAHEHAGWLRFGGGQALWEEAYAPFGVVPFYAGSSGVQAGGWFNREIKSLDDLKGLKIRIAGLGGELLAALGASVTLTPPGEIFGALQSGNIDAAEWVGPSNDVAFGLDQAAQFYYLPAFHEFGPSLELIVNAQAWGSLDEGLKLIVRGAAEATAQETLADFTYANIMAFRALLDKGKVQVRSWPDDVIAALKQQAEAALTRLSQTSEFAGRVHASYSPFLTAASSLSRASERVAYQMRD
jgi:TRAP-type mannitol/chloroaromatic compound transport system substrate-binding protein